MGATCGFEDGVLERLEENFEGYEKNKYTERYLMSGHELFIKENGSVESYDYLGEDKSEDSVLILTNAIQIETNPWFWDWAVLIRTDGTIWAYNNVYGLSRVTESTGTGDIDEETENYIKPTSRLKNTETKNGNILTGINKDTTVADFIQQNNFNNVYQVKIFDKNNNEIAGESLLGTGSIIRLYKNGKTVKEYTVVIYGDTTGDGKITAVDALALIKHINNKILFTDEVFSEAGRVRTNSGTTLTAVDALAIIKNVNGKFTINQNK